MLTLSGKRLGRQFGRPVLIDALSPTMQFVRLFILFAIALGSAYSQSDEKFSRIDRIKAEAYAKHPNDPIEGAKAANRALEQSAIPTAAPEPIQRKTAAIAFLSYYTKNTTGWRAACTEQGVALESYVREFTRVHQPQLVASSVLVGDAAGTIKQFKLDFVSRSRQELNDVAAKKGISLREVCEIIERGAVTATDASHFSKVFPSMNALLISSIPTKP